MGAECDKHGVDLHGDTFNGLVCPVCERESVAQTLADALDSLVSWIDIHDEGARDAYGKRWLVGFTDTTPELRKARRALALTKEDGPA